MRRACVALLSLTLLGGTMPVALADETEDPNLNQAVDADQHVVHGEKVLDSGHVDMGPKFVDGKWTLLIHDDAAKADANATSVWRYPDETVLHVFDQSKLTVPDDPAYAFLGVEPGSPVWVIPQTQNPEVVWLGWNTQDPEVMKRIDRGVTLSLTGVEGPGAVTTYLQSGSFGEPQVLFDSRIADEQAAWVDVNTHTHANWVFTQPGVYLLRLKAEAALVDGSSVSDTQVIRVAVGTDTAPADALAASWAGAAEPGGEGSGGASAAPSEAPAPVAPESSRDGLVTVLIAAIVVVALGLVIGVSVAVVRGNKAKQRILAERAAGSPSASDDPQGGRS